MDRLIATSKAPPQPDWLFPSLINVPRDCKRHCRLFPAGMGDLTQMAQFLDQHEEQKKKKRLHELERKRDCRHFECTEEPVFETGAFEKKRLQKKRRTNVDLDEHKKQRIVVVVEEQRKFLRRNSYDNMIDWVDAPLSSLSPHHPPSSSSMTVPAPPPTALPVPTTTAPRRPSPLTSNPPTPTDLLHARNLTAAHRTHRTHHIPSTHNSTHRTRLPQPYPHLPAAHPAHTSHGTVAVASKCRKWDQGTGAGTGGGQRWEGGKREGRTWDSGREEGCCRVRFAEAVCRGFRGVFG